MGKLPLTLKAFPTVIPWNQLEAILSAALVYEYAPTDEQLVL
jgi:hypothetical protein